MAQTVYEFADLDPTNLLCTFKYCGPTGTVFLDRPQLLEDIKTECRHVDPRPCRARPFRPTTAHS